MKPRRAALLGALALLVVAGALWLSVQRQLPQASLTGERVLPGLAGSVNEVTRIRIARGDGTTTTLQRLDSGEWQVQERAYRADLAKLRRLLLDAAALAVVEEKTRDPANFPTLGLDEPDRPGAQGTLLEIQDAKQTRRLILGRSSGMKSSFVRVPGKQGSALATPQLTIDPQPAGWLDHQLFDLPPERVKAVTRRPAPVAATNAPLAAPDPSFAAFTFEDLRTIDATASLANTPQIGIETKEGMVVELTGIRDAGRYFVAVAARAVEGAEPKVHREASELAARVAGRQFELPAYRFESLFPAPPAPAKGKSKLR